MKYMGYLLQGDAIEDEEQHYVAKKDDFVSSKLLRGLFGDIIMQYFEDIPENLISKEAFVCILALFYEGSLEDRISYMFTMYSIIFLGENHKKEGFIAEKDYLYLLNYLEDHMTLPKQFYAAFEECTIPMAGLLSNSQFITWMRQYQDVMEASIDWYNLYNIELRLDLMLSYCLFLTIHLAQPAVPGTPLASIRNSEENLSSLLLPILTFGVVFRDSLNNSPSCQNDTNPNPLRSFDFIGGEDSCDEDSDGLYDSDHLTEMEMSQSSFRDSATSMNGNDERTSILENAGAVVQDDIGEHISDVSGQGGQRVDTASVPVSARGPTYPSENSATQSRQAQNRSGRLRSRGVQKMGRYMGKAVGGGISRVGHVGRSILHVRKSQGHNQQHSGDQHNDDPAAVLPAGYSFSSESQSTKKYVCGYLHKISDSKWGKKGSWHRRWFVLDRQRGVLSYYRHNPANLMPTSSSQNDNIVHMVDSPVPPGKGTTAASSDPSSEPKTQSVGSTTTVPSSTGSSIGEDDNNDSFGCVSRSTDEAKEAELAVRNTTVIDEPITSGQQQEQDQSQEQQQQTVLYLNEAHPWYRGALDLNMDNVSLLFEKTLARNAPTQYFFQASTLSLHDIDSKRGVKYKLCADTETDFNLWTSAIADVINRKDAQNGKASSGAPVRSHQQLYRQRLLQKQMETEVVQAHDSEGGPDEAADSGHDSPPPVLGRAIPDRHGPVEDRQTTQVLNDAAPSSYVKRNIPPRIVTQFSSDFDNGASCWHLHIHVDGAKQCLIVGFMLNIVALHFLASEHVLWKVAICFTVSGMFVRNVYNPRALHQQRHGSYGDLNGNMEKTRHGTDVAQCSDPAKCCQHKVMPAGSDRGENDGMDGSTDEPHQRSSGADNRSVAKIPMGSTMTQSDMQADGRSSNVEHSWTSTRAETFAVRSSDYKKSRKKQPSKAALFEFIGADFVRTDSKLDLISERVEFPPEHENRRLFVINAQLPSYGPSVWGDSSYDGPGYSLALYWKIPDEIFEELKNPTTKTLKLLKRFLEAGNDTSLTDRFKVIAQVMNQEECGITGMSKKLLMSHNATPVLTRPQHRIYHFQDECTEIVIDIHAFSYIARRGIHSLIDKTSRLVIDLAFVIQGEAEDELPEQVLGCCRLDRINVQKAVDLPC
ncbi:hypothetical protein DD238_001924 [Peronospora effusa]|uniref:PH domain-containing protein n=1 Tax=Peronospora effusa TaxID=542832 RepID=A0A3M6VQU6_9STRA|nr:hypothetical protein DD238_001924 [Peronospora effusa]